MIEIPAMWDGDQYPVRRFTLMDGGVVRDTTTCAVVFKVEDESGNLLGTRPGVLVSPKSVGQVDLYLKGRATDFSGAGKVVVCAPLRWPYGI